MKSKHFSPLQVAVADHLLFLFILYASPVRAEVSTSLYTGITHTSNLEVQTGNDIQANDQDSLTRNGLETGLAWSKQSVDFTGGYVLDAKAIFNKDLSSNNDISSLLLSASKLSALSPNWLLRNSITANGYHNEALPSNSYKGISLNTTLGYLDDTGGGTDISLALVQEQHDQSSDDNYDMTRSSIGLTYYLPHPKNSAYWSVSSTLRNNNSDDNSRDYNSLLLGINRNAISLASFTGQFGAYWQYDNYDQPIRQSNTTTTTTGNTPGMNSPGMSLQTNTTTRIKERRDNLYYLSLQLGKPLTHSLSLQLSTSLGRYDSNINTKADNFYSAAINLVWGLR